MIDVTAQFPLEPGWPRPPMYSLGVTTTVIHHTAAEMLPLGAVMSREDELNHIRVIHQYHRSIGYGGFGYHGIRFVERSYLVTPLWTMGAHVAGKNGGKYGWALAGDFRDRVPTQAQIEGLREDIAELGKPIKPHNFYGGTTCPGRVVEIFDRLEEDDMDEAQVRAIFREMVGPINDRVDSLLGDLAYVDDKLRATIKSIKNRNKLRAVADGDAQGVARAVRKLELG